MQLSLIVALVFTAFAVIFALQNAATVTVVFFVWRADASLALVIVVCLMMGALLSALAALPALVRGRAQVRRQQHRIEELERSLGTVPAESIRADARGSALETMSLPPD